MWTTPFQSGGFESTCCRWNWEKGKCQKMFSGTLPIRSRIVFQFWAIFFRYCCSLEGKLGELPEFDPSTVTDDPLTIYRFEKWYHFGLLTYLIIFATTIIILGLILYVSGCVIANVSFFGLSLGFLDANKINDFWPNLACFEILGPLFNPGIQSKKYLKVNNPKISCAFFAFFRPRHDLLSVHLSICQNLPVFPFFCRKTKPQLKGFVILKKVNSERI